MLSSTLSSLSNTSSCSFPSPSGSILSPSLSKKRSRVSLDTTKEDIKKNEELEYNKQKFQIDPFNQSQINKFLNSLHPPLISYPRFYDFSKKMAPSTTALNNVLKKGKKEGSTILELGMNNY